MRSLIRLRARSCCCSRLCFLPLFTRPAAPRLATRDAIAQVDTNHPQDNPIIRQESAKYKAGLPALLAGHSIPGNSLWGAAHGSEHRPNS